MKNWTWSYLGNLIGSLLMVGLVAASGLLSSSLISANMAVAKTSLPFGQVRSFSLDAKCLVVCGVGRRKTPNTSNCCLVLLCPVLYDTAFSLQGHGVALAGGRAWVAVQLASLLRCLDGLSGHFAARKDVGSVPSRYGLHCSGSRAFCGQHVGIRVDDKQVRG